MQRCVHLYSTGFYPSPHSHVPLTLIMDNLWVKEAKCDLIIPVSSPAAIDQSQSTTQRARAVHLCRGQSETQ